MTVERAVDVTDELVSAVAHLLPQLTSRMTSADDVELVEMLATPGTNLYVARDGANNIVGMLTLVVYRIPTGLRGRIEDVVVDEAARGQGVGVALANAALELAAKVGVDSVELTSSPARASANRLYRRLGFEQRETNVYVWRPR